MSPTCLALASPELCPGLDLSFLLWKVAGVRELDGRGRLAAGCWPYMLLRFSDFIEPSLSSTLTMAIAAFKLQEVANLVLDDTNS